MTQRNKQLDEFCNLYNIRIIDSSSRVAKTYPWLEDKHPTFDTDVLHTVSIPDTSLTQLRVIEAIFFGGPRIQQQKIVFTAWQNQQVTEQKVRADNAAVAAAYEQYVTLLALATPV